MPCTIRLLTPGGLQPVDYTATSLADAAPHEPRDGVYTIANTYHVTRVLKFDAHLNRLEHSALLAGIPLTLDRANLRAALRWMINDADYGDVRYRITAPRDQPNHLIISLEPFQPPAPEIYADGVRCMTVPGSTRSDPAAKTTDWMHDRTAIAQSLPRGIYEGLLLSASGDILEGLGSNFYAVQRGELRTAGDGVLPGIARQIVFEVAPDVLPVRADPVNIADISQLDEAFITSSSRAIIPVIAIDGITIGGGKPGAKTRALMARYTAWVESHLEEL